MVLPRGRMPRKSAQADGPQTTTPLLQVTNAQAGHKYTPYKFATFANADSGSVEVNTVEAFTRFNAPQNLAGLPAISVPCGLAKGLPIGLQFFGAEGADELVLTMASAFQRETHWHQRRRQCPLFRRRFAGERIDLSRRPDQALSVNDQRRPINRPRGPGGKRRLRHTRPDIAARRQPCCKRRRERR